jgi:IS30 family transposase
MTRRRSRISPEMADQIRKLDGQGKTERQIIEATGVSKGSVWRSLRQRRSVAQAVEWTPRPDRLGLGDRVAISVGLALKETFTTIGARIGRHVSTVSREVGGCAGWDGYDPVEAHQRAQRNTARPKLCKLAANPMLYERVWNDLEMWWSPEQISARLRHDFPTSSEMRLSPEAIYQALFVQTRGELRKELASLLRSGRTSRRPRGSDDRRRQGPIPEPVTIKERPEEIEDRLLPGHWEGDLVFGSGNKHAIGTLVERQTRYVMLLHLPDGHSADQVRMAMAAKIQTLPDALFKSVTWDRGAEMARHREFTLETGVNVYFCDPHSPWQRGTNENTNGLLRQYFPKGVSLANVTAADLDQAADSLNNRPRETLNWLKPTEALQQLLALTP